MSFELKNGYIIKRNSDGKSFKMFEECSSSAGRGEGNSGVGCLLLEVENFEPYEKKVEPYEKIVINNYQDGSDYTLIVGEQIVRCDEKNIIDTFNESDKESNYILCDHYKPPKELGQFKNAEITTEGGEQFKKYTFTKGVVLQNLTHEETIKQMQLVKTVSGGKKHRISKKRKTLNEKMKKRKNIKKKRTSRRFI